MKFISRIRDFFSSRPVIFNFLRKIIELNFIRQKNIIANSYEMAGRGSVLDVGCGTGEFAYIFDKDNYIGIDITPEYISYAQKTRSGSFHLMDARSLPYADKRFDFVLIMAILHHLNDEDAIRVISEANRVVKDHGKILILEDAKIPRLESTIVRLVQKFDKGEYIRTPENYRKIISAILTIKEESELRNGGCIYFYSLAEKKL